MISQDMRVRLRELRDSVVEVQAAYYDKGWYGGQPMTLAEYESPDVKGHWEAVKERAEQSTVTFNVNFAAVLALLEIENA